MARPSFSILIQTLKFKRSRHIFSQHTSLLAQLAFVPFPLASSHYSSIVANIDQYGSTTITFERVPCPTVLRSIALRAMTGLWSPCAQRFHDGVDFLPGDLSWDGGFGPKGDAFGSRNEMEWMDRRIQNRRIQNRRNIYIYDYIHNVNFCGNLLWDNTRPQVSVISSLALHFIDAPNEIQDSSLCFGR